MGEENFLEQLKDTKLTCRFGKGSPALLKGLANLYNHMKPENILVNGGAIGANFLVARALGYLRIGYGCKTQTLKAGLSRIKDFFSSCQR